MKPMVTKTINKTTHLAKRFAAVRQQTTAICQPLQTEDYVVQPIVDVSPPKWHLGHTTWFWEQFVLQAFNPDYTVFDKNFAYIFNSYYQAAGDRIVRTNRGNLSRPIVEKVYAYRKHVDAAMAKFLTTEQSEGILHVIETGLNHEEQHQELLLTDIKCILGHNPLFPAYGKIDMAQKIHSAMQWIQMPEGIYEMGYDGDEFCFDNELNRHKVYLQSYSIANRLITNKEYLTFIDAGGYAQFAHWHAEGWDWLQNENIKAPMYWHFQQGEWLNYTLQGLQEIEWDAPVKHISYFEAHAFANWKGHRLPTEFEWEAANEKFNWGERWEWTESAYLPYPGFITAEGALGEYNGKFMVNQKVLRGASVATTAGHSRPTYRNFFHANLKWQFTGIRLAK